MLRVVVHGWLVLLASGAAGGCHAPTPSATFTPRVREDRGPIGPEHAQLITVVSDRWSEFRATLRRYEREPGATWRPVGKAIEVVLGRNGYGWGRGLHGPGTPQGRSGPIKREGDGRSPAGVFSLGAVYGYAETAENVSSTYVRATGALRCVDDPRSTHYNRIVSVERVDRDWQSAEHMRREDDLYTLAIVVEHNTQATAPGAGSCIFIHLWEGPDRGMSGCTALPMEALGTLAGWLEPGAALVALPESEYDALTAAWQLPSHASAYPPSQ